MSFITEKGFAIRIYGYSQSRKVQFLGVGNSTYLKISATDTNLPLERVG